MGMTIDKTIIQATLLKDGVGKDTYKYEILTSLIDIAKKYQQIVKIYREWFSDAGHTSAETYRRIGEVLKDENDN